MTLRFRLDLQFNPDLMQNLNLPIVKEVSSRLSPTIPLVIDGTSNFVLSQETGKVVEHRVLDVAVNGQPSVKRAFDWARQLARGGGGGGALVPPGGASVPPGVQSVPGLLDFVASLVSTSSRQSP